MDRLISNKKLPPEVEKGNIEYKLKVNAKSKARQGSLQSQMRWRIAEGEAINGIPEAIYYVGIDDNGCLGNQTITELKSSIEEIKNIADEIGAKIDSKIIKKIDSSFVAEIKVRRFIEAEQKDEIKVCFIGSSGVGKTSIFANICYNIEDNDGIGRKSVLRYAHEKEDGITSSIINEILGINNEEVLNYTDFSDSEWENIYKNSDKIINIVDIPGDHKYYKTGFYGFLSQKPDYCVFVFSADIVYDDSFYKPYFQLVQELGLKIAVIFNKSDLNIQKHKQKILSEIKKYFKEFELFDVSCVNSLGINEFKKWFINLNKNIVPINIGDRFLVTDILKSSDVGQIITGVMIDGKIKIGDTYMVGPLRPDSTIISSKVISIHKKLIPSTELVKGENGSIVLSLDLKNSKGLDKQCQVLSDEYCDYFTDTIELETNDILCYNMLVDSHYSLFLDNFVESVVIKKISIKNREENIFNIQVKFIKKECQKCVIKSTCGILRNSALILIAKTI